MSQTREVMRLIIFIILVFIFIHLTFAGFSQYSRETEVYKVNRKVETPGTVALLGVSVWGFNHLSEKPGLSYEEAIQLSPNDVWWFDRPATRQDPSFRMKAQNNSDILLNSSVILPGLLALDRQIRHDWFDVLLLYGESHAISTDFYILNASLISRARPFNYNSGIPIEEKMANESQNSFFSGHVSTAATASFFMAKVYSDYHPELGNKKYWLFAAALIPPSMVGYYRFRAMKHFPTDIMTGCAIGAATGILIPHFHKINRKNTGLTFVPFTGTYTGVKISYLMK